MGLEAGQPKGPIAGDLDDLSGLADDLGVVDQVEESVIHRTSSAGRTKVRVECGVGKGKQLTAQNGAYERANEIKLWAGISAAASLLTVDLDSAEPVARRECFVRRTPPAVRIYGKGVGCSVQ